MYLQISISSYTNYGGETHKYKPCYNTQESVLDCALSPCCASLLDAGSRRATWNKPATLRDGENFAHALDTARAHSLTHSCEYESSRSHCSAAHVYTYKTKKESFSADPASCIACVNNLSSKRPSTVEVARRRLFWSYFILCGDGHGYPCVLREDTLRLFPFLLLGLW